ncbi:MAG: putative toxin-antitoxin system toxin component, PIN family [Arcicella sp.]|nr:putative toxin-antitoxin system toxin component, PIN family [Arcicella sp.]
MRVVIDTNVLRLTIKKGNFERFIYDAFKLEAFEWIVSTEILDEYEEKLIEFYSIQTADLVLSVLENAPNVIFAEPYFRWNIITKDPDDNKFSDLGISLNVDCLVTNDKHFNVFKKLDFPKLKIVNPKQFHSLLNC